MNQTLVENTERVLALGRRHAGETIVLLGSGPQLGLLSDEDWDWIDAHTTIGVNRTMLVCSPTYLLSAYSQEAAICGYVDPDVQSIVMRSTYAPCAVPGALTVRRRMLDRHRRLDPYFRAPLPTLRTANNVIFGATHLALVLGAGRVVYVGFEQRNKAHFYDGRPELVALLRDLLIRAADEGHLSDDHDTVSLDGLLGSLDVDADDLRATPFYEQDHTENLAWYFEELRAHGVEVVATLADSVVADAGANVSTIAQLAVDHPAGHPPGT